MVRTINLMEIIVTDMGMLNEDLGESEWRKVKIDGKSFMVKCLGSGKSSPIMKCINEINQLLKKMELPKAFFSFVTSKEDYKKFLILRVTLNDWESKLLPIKNLYDKGLIEASINTWITIE